MANIELESTHDIDDIMDKIFNEKDPSVVLDLMLDHIYSVESPYEYEIEAAKLVAHINTRVAKDTAIPPARAHREDQEEEEL